MPIMLPDAVQRNFPAMVRTEVARLSPERQSEFLEEYQRKAKATGVAYLLWFFLGWHYVYFRKWGIQILFWITLGGVGFWWVIDAFRLPHVTRDYNKDVALEVLRNMKSISASAGQ